MSRLATAGIAGVLVLAALLDLVSVRGTPAGGWLALSFAVAALSAAAVLRRRRAPRALLMRVGLGLGAVSLVLTGVMRATSGGAHATWGVLESAALALLLGVLTRRWAKAHDSAALLALAAALVAAPWRVASADAALFSLLAALMVAAVVAVGLLRRADDLASSRALLRVRNDERRDIARDLHDEVAHHVTGIIVAAQAAAVTVGTDPDAAGEALARIERTGIEALESMRYLVAVLRAPDQQQDPRRGAARWPNDLQELVERFGATTGLTTTLALPAGHIPAAHRQAVLRVAQEALTNIHRHAVGATRADVVVTLDYSSLRVSVTDDGRPDVSASSDVVRAGGGFGLVGLRERAAALGGSVSAGHRDPHGWQVDLMLPPLGSEGLR